MHSPGSQNYLPDGCGTGRYRPQEFPHQKCGTCLHLGPNDAGVRLRPALQPQPPTQSAPRTEATQPPASDATPISSSLKASYKKSPYIQKSSKQWPATTDHS